MERFWIAAVVANKGLSPGQMSSKLAGYTECVNWAEDQLTKNPSLQIVILEAHTLIRAEKPKPAIITETLIQATPQKPNNGLRTLPPFVEKRPHPVQAIENDFD